MSINAALKATLVCNEHSIANCGVCAEKYGTDLAHFANCGRCLGDDDPNLVEDQETLRKKLLKKKKSKEIMECDRLPMDKSDDEEVPEILECDTLSVAQQRKHTLSKIARFAGLRNDQRIVEEVKTIRALLK